MIQEQPRYPVLEEGKPNLTYSMIKENLAEALPISIIRQVDKGRFQADYVNITDLKDLLDIRAGVWTSEIIAAQQIGNQFAAIVRISIHAADGVFSHDGNGIEDVNLDSYGDSFSNAYAQAFRRACESHSLGRELWRKEESNQAVQPQKRHQPQQQQLPQNSAEQSKTSSTSNGEPATKKQLNYITSLCVEKSLDEVDLAKERHNVKFEELNKNQASDLIKYVSDYKK